MRIGPRYLHKQHPFPSGDAEREALVTALKSAPGLVAVLTIEPHRKGGHRAELEVNGASLVAFIGHMDAHGWLDAL